MGMWSTHTFAKDVCVLGVPMQHEDLQWGGLRVGHDFSACLSVCGLVP